MYLEKYLEEIIKKYHEDETYRYIANFVFSSQLEDTTDQPGAILLGNISEETRLNFLNLIDKEDWNKGEKRHLLKPQEETHNITLFGTLSNLISKETLKGKRYNSIINFARDFAHKVGKGKLAGIMLVNLPANKHVKKHFDGGARFVITDRYHVILNSQEGNKQVFSNGDEYFFKNNEIWWYNINIEHYAINESNADRIHIIIDVVPYKNQMIELKINDLVLSKKLIGMPIHEL